MKAVDTTYLIDYLAEPENGPAARFLEANENVPLYAPTLALNEVYRGTVFADSGGDDVGALARKLEWLEHLPFTEQSAREAVEIERELRADGEPINRLDVLIAGVVRNAGAELVTRDTHFRNVDGLDVVEYADG